MNIDVIAQIYLPEPGGFFAADLARHWASSGHRVRVWTASEPTPLDGADGVDVMRVSGAYQRGSLIGRAMSQVGFFGRTAVQLGRESMRSRETDVVVAVGSPVLPTFLPCARPGRSTRVIQWVHDLYPEALLALLPHRRAVGAVAPSVTVALNFAWRRADAVVAISPAMWARIRSRAPRASVQMIPLWAPADVVSPSMRSGAMRRSRNIAEDAFVVMYHGNLGLAYDFEPLFAAAHALSAEERCVFAIVGSGSQRARLERRAEQERLSGLRIYPPVSGNELAASLAMGDCHIVSVRPGWDGLAFPSKFIAALAAGRPVLVVGPDDVEVAELVRRHGCGTVVSSGRDLVEAILRLARDPQDAQRQGARGRVLYEQVFDRQRRLEEWDALLVGSAVTGAATSAREARVSFER